MTAWLWGFGALGLVAICGIIIGGNRVRTQDVIKDLKANIDTTKRMDDADIVGDDPAAAKRWLADRLRDDAK
jgi:hypothetical protein